MNAHAPSGQADITAKHRRHDDINRRAEALALLAAAALIALALWWRA